MGEFWDDDDDNEMEDDFDDNDNNSIDLDEIIEKAKNYPLSGFFLETRKRAKKRSAMSWLESCDTDTVKMICSYGKNAKINIKQSNEEKAEENKGYDVFDPVTEAEIESSKTIVSNDEDYYTLVVLILAWEGSMDTINHEEIAEASYRLRTYAAIDILKRNEIVESKGNGKLLSKHTKYVLTKKCQKMTKKEISNALKLIKEVGSKK